MAVELTPEQARAMGLHVPKGQRTKARLSRAGEGDGTSSWRCAGVGGCGQTITGTYRAAERHLRDHHDGHGRLEHTCDAT